jgi:hypothetical protein
LCHLFPGRRTHRRHVAVRRIQAIPTLIANQRMFLRRSDSGAGSVRIAYLSRSSSWTCCTKITIAYFTEK